MSHYFLAYQFIIIFSSIDSYYNDILFIPKINNIGHIFMYLMISLKLFLMYLDVYNIQ